MSNLTTLCVECEGEVNLDANVEQNEIVVCPDCGVDLEVISLDPLTLDVAPMEDEDWGE
ncbi:MAG: lysine biosynthesis protein LysW [Anaerolineales bacterium]